VAESGYKFYLSFENSFCTGYVTEKFYKALELDIIPVVMGGADYKARAPPKSYIDVLDFDTPAELAAFLLDLAGNEEEYLSYFWWKVSRAQQSALLTPPSTTTRCTAGRESGPPRPCAGCASGSTPPATGRSRATRDWAGGGGGLATASARGRCPGPGPAPPGPTPHFNTSQPADI